MAHNKVYAVCADMCLEETLTKEQILGLDGDIYSNSSTYSVGDLVIYNNGLYKCNTTISTAEEWTAAHWTATTLSNEIEGKQKTITSGTANPSGGNNGDIYFQYVE